MNPICEQLTNLAKERMKLEIKMRTHIFFIRQISKYNLAQKMKRNCGLYYKHVTIVNYTSSGVNKLKASLNDDTRVIIYDHHMFIVQATCIVKAFHALAYFK